jgi:hypothetical protein
MDGRLAKIKATSDFEVAASQVRWNCFSGKRIGQAARQALS